MVPRLSTMGEDRTIITRGSGGVRSSTTLAIMDMAPAIDRAMRDLLLDQALQLPDRLYRRTPRHSFSNVRTSLDLWADMPIH